MKKLSALFLTIIMILSMLGQTALAAQVTDAALDLSSYLNKVSSIRGFEVSQEDIEYSLLFGEKSLSDFGSVKELETYQGEVIKSDLSNLSQVYDKYSLDSDAVKNLFAEYGEELNDYIFVNDLEDALAFYTTDGEVEQEADFDAKLTSYLNEISSIRGIVITKEDMINYLSEYDLSLKDMESVTQLKDLIGEVIKADLSNLDNFKSVFQMDKGEILQLLSQKSKSIDEFFFMDQLELYLWDATGTIPGIDISDYMDLLSQMGITMEEIQKLENHFASLEEYLSSDEIQAKFEELSTYFMTFGSSLLEHSSDENYVPGKEEVTELISKLEDLLSTMKLKVVITVSKGGIDTQYTLSDLLSMSIAEELDLTDSDITIAYYNDDGELLLDMVLTSEFMKDNLGDVLEDAGTVIDKELPVAVSQGEKTVKGAELPKTSSNRTAYALIGMFLSMIGFILLKKARTDKSETDKK